MNDVRTVNVEHSVAVEALKHAGDEVFLVCGFLILITVELRHYLRCTWLDVIELNSSPKQFYKLYWDQK